MCSLHLLVWVGVDVGVNDSVGVSKDFILESSGRLVGT